ILADSMAVRFHVQQANRPLANLFGDLALDEVRDLHGRLTWLRLRPGDVLFRAGDAGDAVYLILGGRLRAVEESPDGSRGDVNEMFFGESVGEIALLTDAPRSLTVEAARETYVARLGAEDFDALVDRHPRVLKRLARIVVDRQRRATSAKVETLSMCVLPAPDLAPARFEEFITRFVRGVDRKSTRLNSSH